MQKEISPGWATKDLQDELLQFNLFICSIAQCNIINNYLSKYKFWSQTKLNKNLSGVVLDYKQSLYLQMQAPQHFFQEDSQGSFRTPIPVRSLTDIQGWPAFLLYSFWWDSSIPSCYPIIIFSPLQKSSPVHPFFPTLDLDFTLMYNHLPYSHFSCIPIHYSGNIKYYSNCSLNLFLSLFPWLSKHRFSTIITFPGLWP